MEIAFKEFEEEIELNNGDLVVDLGAWKGEFSEWALSKGARVIAYEPSGEYDKAIKKAVWVKNGTVKYKRTTGSGNMINHGDEIIECVDIRDVTNQPISLLKVNIEGAEVEVLNRANLDNIDQILVEFHVWIGLVSKEDVDKLVKKLSKDYEYIRKGKHPDYLFKRKKEFKRF